MSFHVIIPARMHSSRLPRKVLLDIGGKPMLQRVYEQACASRAASITIATDHEEIQQAAQSWGARVCLTSAEHPSGTDRLAQAIGTLGFQANDIVVNVQGDEPFIPPQVINQVALLLDASAKASVATLCEPITSPEQMFDPNIVKVVVNHQGEALYFSRAPIPWDRQRFADAASSQVTAITQAYRHIGLYAYRAGFVKHFVTLAPAPLEQLEQLEQLRALFYGHTIAVAISEAQSPVGVDTEADLLLARKLAENYV